MAHRTGADYLERLQDGRRVLVDGQLIASVMTTPSLEAHAKKMAQYYDHHRALERSFCPNSGLSWSYKIPQSKEDLAARSLHYESFALATLGAMGRSPDYMNTILAAATSAKHHWFMKDPMRLKAWDSFYNQVSESNVSWSHACINWTPQKENQKSALRIVKRTGEGIYVSGWRSVATAAAVCEWLFCFQPAMAHLNESESEMALSFVVPLSCEGLTIVMRPTMETQASMSFVDEGDCLIRFQDCFIPYDRVLIDGNCELYNAQGSFMAFENFAGHQVLIRRLVRSKFLFGVAHLLAHTMGLDRYVNVSEKLGEFVVIIQTLESLALAAVEGSSWDEALQAQVPFSSAVSASLRLYPDFYDRMQAHLLTLGASRWSAMPPTSSLLYLEQEEPLPFEGKAWQQALYQLAQEQTTSAFSARDRLYERNFAGDLELMRASLYHQTDKSSITKWLLRYLKQQPL